MSFESALKLLKSGSCLTRTGWNGRGMWIAIAQPDAKSLLTLPYIYIRTANGYMVPWCPDASDLLAGDWVEKK